MSRRGSAKPAGIQLFPFLAVLICTMGALVVLLHAFASHGREQAEKISKSKLKEQSEQDEIDADFFRWRSAHLLESRTKTQADLDSERLKLSHIEEHQRRLEARFSELKIAAEEMAKAMDDKTTERAQNETALAKVQDELAKVRAATDEARKKGKNEVVNYSIVPFEGRNGTHRRPIYIECCENKLVLQPEGIELLPEDFIGYFGAGNPLAAGLRAQREYFARQAPGGTLQEEPYPLLIVRPEGIASYYAARAALESWGNDFGYELIGADWNLTFPPSDPQLKEITARVVSEARQRLTEFIATSPQFQKRRTRPVYHAKSRGGVSQVPGTGDGPGGSFLGEWDNPENWNSSESGPRGSRGAYAAGGFADSANDQYAPFGASGGNPYAEPSSISPQMNGGRGRGTVDGNQFAEMQRGTGSSAGAAGTGPGGVDAQDGPYGGTGPARKFEGVGGGGVPQARVGPAALGGGPSHAQTPTGTAKPGGDGQAGTITQAGQPSAAPGTNYQLMAGGGKGSSGGEQSAQSAASGELPEDPDLPDVAKHGVPDSLTLNHAPNSQMMGKRTKATQSIAVTRGKGWSVNSQVGTIGASRPILVRCSADSLVIVPESSRQAANEIPLGPVTAASIDDLISGVWTQTETWGKAGRGMYWKPKLLVEVLPGGEDRFEDLQVLLHESGLDVKRRGAQQPVQQAIRPTNQR